MDEQYRYDASGALLNPTRTLPFSGPIEFKPEPMDRDRQVRPCSFQTAPNWADRDWFRAY